MPNRSIEKAEDGKVRGELRDECDTAIGFTELQDTSLLMSMGKVQELKRYHGFWTLCAYQIMMMASWSCNVVLYSTVFDLGGPMAMIWGTLVVAAGQTLLMTSLAEFCSIWPTAGGQQYFTQMLAKKSFRPFLSYLVGWAVIVGDISLGASCALNSANIINSFVSITHPDYEWHPWLTWLVYTVFLVGPVLQNLMPHYLPILNIFGAVWTVGGGMAWAACFLALAPKQDAKFVFTLFTNNSGYTNSGWVFIMSLYTPMYALYGTDGVLHLVEETKDATRVSPRAMVWSMIFCSITAWASAIIMMFCVGDWSVNLLGVQPYMDWFINILQSTYGGGLFCSIVMIGINYFIVVGTNTAGSRLVWSMARDKAFPYSEYYALVSERFGVPLRALVALLIISWLIGLIALGSDLAFQAIISGGAIMMQIGYMTPVVLVLMRGRDILPKNGHFNLGRLGYPINIVTVCWSVIICIVYVCPLYVPVNSDNIGNMNWAILIVGATVIIPGMYWVWGARHKYCKNEESVV